MNAQASGGAAPARAMTVARVRAQPTQFDVMFHESARIYRLSRTHPQFDALLARLQRAAAERKPVHVRFGGADDEEIVSVGEP